MVLSPKARSSQRHFGERCRLPCREPTASAVALNDDEYRIKDQGIFLKLKEYHDRLDAAVARADEQILERLIALNVERADERIASPRMLLNNPRRQLAC